MISLQNILSRVRRGGRSDVVGLDVGEMTTKIVRLKRVGGAITVVAADLLPRLAPPALDVADVRPEPLTVARELQGRHAAIAVSTPHASIRLLTIPGSHENVEQLNFSELLGVPEGVEYRIGYEVLTADSRAEQTVLAAGMPLAHARWAAALLPRGLPAPCSLQVGGVAALNSMGAGVGDLRGETTVLSVHLGTEVTHVAAFHRGRLALFRQCLIGNQTIVKIVRERLGIEEELVPGILDDSVIDVSQAIGVAIEPFLRQLMLAREFVERKRTCHIERILLCGSLLGTKHWMAHIEATTGIRPEVWNPFAGLPVAAGALTDRVKGVESRFTGAVGAALAALENPRDLPHRPAA